MLIPDYLRTEFIYSLPYETSVTMAGRWFFLLLGVVLLQNTISYSPIPELEEEWMAFTEQLRDPSYRLPTTTIPTHYEVSLTPYFDVAPTTERQFTFDGTVMIRINAIEENISEIVMHCNDLTIRDASVQYTVDGVPKNILVAETERTCEMPYSFLRLRTSEALQLNQEYVVTISFIGNLQTNMRGFYRSFYFDSNGRKWMGTTQFQPGHARQAFPCYDEPGFKATFDITIIRPSDFSPTISNMPIRQTTVNTETNRVAETFYTTPYTSTYLLAFIVSHYEKIAAGTNPQRPFDIYARNNARGTGEWALEIGEALLTAMEELTDIPYYTMQDNLDMKQAAIPDFSAGAMENWGLLTYREALILYDPQNSNHFYLQRVANIVSHEITHMWFGNLVTCAWWDNLWLNEGFARFYQYYLTGAVRPDLGYATRFIVEQLHTAMFSDSIDSAHPLTDPSVNDPTTVSAHFSTITYARGASILRMTQHLLGEETYLKGLRLYLDERKFDVAEPHHLFSALDRAAAEDNALLGYGITIDAYFRTWSEKAGHPLLSVVVDQATGRMTVTQARWERNTGVSQSNSLWHIPITWTRGGDVNFDNLKPSQIITEQSTVIQRGTTGLEWVIFNKQESGFYRVNYDDTNWALITRALRDSVQRPLIHEYNRGQIVNDVFAFARAGIMRYERAYNIMSFLQFEDQYAPWLAAIDGFSFVRRRLAHDADNLQKLHEMIIQWSTAVVNRLGYAEVANESYMDGLLRMYVMEFLCNIGHSGCVNAAVQNFQNWKNGAFIPANLRPWVYCTGLRNGNADDFNYFWQRYEAEDLASEQVVMLQTAGCTSDTASLERFLSAVVADTDDVRPQDYSTAYNGAVTANEYNTMRVFNWLTNNYEAANTAFGSLLTPLNTIAGRLLTNDNFDVFTRWVELNREYMGESVYASTISSIESARSNLAWSEQRIPELAQYFETGYVEDVIEDITDPDPVPTQAPTTAAPTTVEPTTEPEPDSANMAALSLVTLFVTLLINYVV